MELKDYLIRQVLHSKGVLKKNENDISKVDTRNVLISRDDFRIKI